MIQKKNVRYSMMRKRNCMKKFVVVMMVAVLLSAVPEMAGNSGGIVMYGNVPIQAEEQE